MKKRLRLEYLNKDKPNPEEEGMEAAGVDVIDVVSGGSRLYGSVLLPDGSYESSRPCVILFHGFPGTARNDDYAQALRRCGCVVRFAKYLHKLTSDTQFIVITHRRGTMNAADRLYGITMQEKGVSTLVSVNLIENDLDK